MSGVEFIGFAISLLSLLFLFFRNRSQMANQQTKDDQTEEDLIEYDPIQAFLKRMENERKKKEAPPPPPKDIVRPSQAGFKKAKKPSKVESDRVKSEAEKRKEHISLEEYRVKSSAAKREEIELSTSFYGGEINPTPTRAKAAIDRLTDLKDIVIFHEILNKPKSLRPWE